MSVRIFWLLIMGFGCAGCDTPKLFWEKEVRQLVGDIPKLFWEKELRQVVGDVVVEKEKLNHDHSTNR